MLTSPTAYLNIFGGNGHMGIGHFWYPIRALEVPLSDHLHRCPFCPSAQFPQIFIFFKYPFPRIPICHKYSFLQFPICPKSPFILWCPFLPTAHLPSIYSKFTSSKSHFTSSSGATLHSSGLTPLPFVRDPFV